VTFSLCEKDTTCPELIGYSLVKSIPAPNCSVCTGSNSNNSNEEKEAHLDSQGERKMRIK